jgi:peptide/nickel transport system substrate-binding protein
MTARYPRSIAVGIAALLSGLVLAACGTTTKTPQANTDGTRPASVDLVRLAGSNLGYPSPYAYNKGPGLAHTFLLFDSLLWKDSTGKLMPWLATARERSADGKEWTFTLRDGVKWADGQPLTADDVAFTFDYITKGPAKTALGVIGTVPVAETVVLAPNKVVLKLDKPFAPFEETVAGRVPIVPKHIWSTVTDPAKYRDPAAVIGTGPYTLLSSDETAGTYEYAAKADYWLGTPYVKRVQFVPAPNELLALQRGEIDIASVTQTPAEVVDPLKNDPRFGMITAPGESTTALHFDVAKGFPFNDKRFRQAVAYTVDRNDMVKRILLGNGEPGFMGNVAASAPFAAPDLPTYNRDIAKSKALLDEAGLKDVTGDGVRDLPSGEAFAPELLITATQSKAADLLKEFLREVGVNLQIKSVDQAAADSAVAESRFDMALVGYGALGSDPDWLRQRLSSKLPSKSFLRIQGWNNPIFEDAAAQQLVTVDPAERLKLVYQMQRAVAEDVPVMALYLETRTAIFNKAAFADWYYTPGGVFGLYPHFLNKHTLATGKTTGI